MLKGIRVLDCGVFGVGPFACSFLGCLGAEVVRIEPPHLDGLMFVGTIQGGAGTGYISSHLNKKNIILDLKSPKDQEIALQIAERADIIIENHPPNMIERLGLGYRIVSQINPRIIFCSCSGYGHKGPLSKLRGADHYMQASSGFASLNGTPGGQMEILRYVSHIDMTTALTICQAVLLALLAREVTGEGQEIVMSQFEASIAMQASRIAEFFATGMNPKRLGSANSCIVPSQAFKTLDNKYISVSVPREEFWSRLCRALELDQFENDKRFNSNSERVKNRDQLLPILEAKFLQEPARWWLILLQRYDVPCASLNTFDDIVVDPHILKNKMIEILDTHWGKSMFGGFPLRFSNSPRPTVLEPPAKPDENRKDILGEIREIAEKRPLKQPNLSGRKIESPLEAITVIELGEEISGAFCSMELADAGADVIKIEPFNGDWTRSLGVKIKGESALFLALNRNKRSIAIDAGQTEGKRIIHKLGKRADVFLESGRPGEAERLQLGYKDLQQVAPNIIYCSISPFGATGLYSDRAASELEIQSMSGYLWFLGEPGEAPVRVGADIAGVTAGIVAFIGILSALYYRNKAGVGQKVETSMLGALMATGTYWLTAHYNPDHWGGWFATGPFDHAEQGYQTKDKPILFGLPFGANRAKKGWVDFCTKLGLDDFLKDPWFLENGWRVVGAGRDAQEMKPVFETAFREKSAQELVEIIDSVGGRSGIMETYEEIFAEPQVHALDMVQEIEHPVAGTIKTTGMPWKLSKTPARIRKPPPTVGQQTEEILREIGYSKGEVIELRKVKIVA